MWFLVVFLSGTLAGSALARDKPDLVVLINGNELNGEIKGLDQGQLSLSTDSMGTVRIEWDDVTTVSSQFRFEVEVSDGARYFGPIDGAGVVGQLRVRDPDGTEALPMQGIIRITPIEDALRGRLSGSLSLGLSLAKGDSLASPQVWLTEMRCGH